MVSRVTLSFATEHLRPDGPAWVMGMPSVERMEEMRMPVQPWQRPLLRDAIGDAVPSEPRGMTPEERMSRRIVRRRRCEQGYRAGVALGPSDDGVEWKAVSFLCGLRECGRCARSRGREIQRRVARMCRVFGGFSALCTLTAAPDLGPSDGRYEWIQKSARKFIAAIRRKYPALRGRAYAWVIEAHKSGEPHIHIVWAGYRPYEAEYGWAAAAWRRATGDKSAKARGNVDWKLGQNPDKAGWYIAKYVSKGGDFPDDAIQEMAEMKTRTYGAARGWKISIAWPQIWCDVRGEYVTWGWQVFRGGRDPMAGTPLRVIGGDGET